MCGISGIVHFDQTRSVQRGVLEAMNAVLSHRGPDADGLFLEEYVGLGHRRLSIIDLETGAQPMLSADRNVVITYNGEIYNYLELREELEKLNHQFLTDSDTEVILQAYLEWGVDCLQRLNGMWAFAIWDKSKKRLFLARDRIGEKPLHYALHDNSFLFASEIKSIIKYGLPKEINEEVMDIYLTLGYVPAPYSFYKNIHKLMPGHFAIVENGDLKISEYWDLPEIDESNMIEDQPLIYEKFSSLFSDSIKIRMRSDVDFGVFLSGGLDSSSIAALMSEHSGSKVRSFTIGYKEKDFDETVLAKQVADKFDLEYNELIVDLDVLDESLRKVSTSYDEPFGDSSAIAVDQVARFASQHVKMVLGGDGGDELLSGYTSYQGEKFSAQYSQIPGAARKGIESSIDVMSKLTRGKMRYKANRALSVSQSAGLDFNARLLAKRSWIEREKTERVLQNFPHCISAKSYIDDIMSRCPYKDPFYQLMYFHLKVALPDDMLVKVDRMTMHNSLEVRTPFLDHRLLEFMVGVSKKVKMQGYERKSILRNTVGKQLPSDLLNAPKKGFVVPVREWFKDPNIQDRLNNMFKSSLPLDRKCIKELITDNRTGKKDYGNFIWMLLVLDEFAN